MTRASRRRTPRRGPFRIADWYLFSQVMGAALSGLLRFAGLLVVFGVLGAVKRYADGSLSLSGMAEVILYQLPRVFVFTLPMSILFGTVQAFSDLSNRGEITAMGAGGMSLPQMLRAPLVCGTLLAIMAFAVQEAFVPAAETKKSEILKKQVEQILEKSKNISWRDPAKGPIRKLVQAERFDPKTNTLIKPSVQFNEGLSPLFIIKAEKGFWNEANGQWKFSKGKITQFPPEGGTSEEASNVVEFDEIWRDDVPNPDRLQALGKTLNEHLANGDFEMVSIGDLQTWRTQLQFERAALKTSDERAKQDSLIRGATFGIHDKIATPLICIVLILVGAPLGIRPQRSSGGFSLGVSLVVILIYYATWSWASTLGKGGTGNPLVFAYLAFIFTLIAGTVLVVKKSR
ncbi:MAG TPA: LptF/LptG family permease [Abditibacteriaceae bacterium]|jgi:lipopolysaccharide export system permease protein